MLFNHDKSQHRRRSVMLIEIPDPEVILSVILAFVIGLGMEIVPAEVIFTKTSFS